MRELRNLHVFSSGLQVVIVTVDHSSLTNLLTYYGELYIMDDFILAYVKGVYMTNTLHGPTPVVIISNEDEEIMPIYVGMAEGVSIHSALNNEVTQRPMTHDLMMTIIERLSSTVTGVQIDEIRDGIYYARLTLLYDGSSIDIDARPSDCISLAVRRNVPIKVRRSVFESSVISEDELDGSISIQTFL